jgi:hypothetical protein
MKQDETVLVREALHQAQESLRRNGRLLPGAYMLVRCNPQTGALLTYPTAIATTCDRPFGSRTEYLEFLQLVRREAKRLQAVAVALGGEAEAEIEPGPAAAQAKQLVFYLRVEDAQGVHHLHAVLERDALGQAKLGPLLDAGDASDDLTEPLLP